MICLSCFDGMSCGQIAFERAGIPIKKYYASEIDKYAIKVTQSNYPETVQLGSITEWQSWNIEKPDIIIGGSPCQGFSFAGKQLNFEDERSKLFFVFVDILKHYKPKYFLLENVIMKKEYNDVISSILGDIYPECVTQAELFRTGRLEPIEINSALVSAQNRRRLYWTNIPGIEKPEDKGILLKDIIENATTERDKSLAITSSYYMQDSTEDYLKKKRKQLVITCGAFRGRNPENTVIGKVGNQNNWKEYKGKSPTLTAIQGGNQEPKIAVKSQTILSTLYKENLKSMKDRGKDGLHIGWRKLTPLECERLQTVPDNYTNHVSNSQRYKMLGNGWTVDIIAHIFRGIKHAD